MPKGMTVLVIGSGGREHTLYEKIKLSPLVARTLVAPGNGGITARDRRDIKADDLQGLLALVEAEKVDLTVVGPEVPLVAGIADLFNEHGHAVVGPSAAAARLEGSKLYCKQICTKYQIPTAQYQFAETLGMAQGLIEQWPWGVPVIKADGLCAGKGVHVAKKAVDAYEFVQELLSGRLGDSSRGILLERKLEGRECSVMALVDGRTAIIFQPARDYKRVSAESGAPNTGGMGAFSPLPDVPVTGHEYRRICSIIVKLVSAMAAEGHPYHGVLYAGIMLTKDGPMLLEVNCRLGDPETQVLLPRIEGDIVPALLASTELGGFEKHNVGVLHWSTMSAVCVVMTSGGYPGKYATGQPIRGIHAAKEYGLVYHAGTVFVPDEAEYKTAGGRVLNLVGLGRSLADAQQHAYAGVNCISWDGESHRRDIASDALEVAATA